LEEWIDAHQKRLRYAYDKARERTNDRAEYRKTVHDHKRLIQKYVLVIKYTLETVVFVEETKYKIPGTLQFTVYYVCPNTLLL